MDFQVGDIIALYHPKNDPVYASHFRVEGFDGVTGVEVHCLNGSWDGIYDPEMMMLEIHAPSGSNYMVCTHKVLTTTRPLTAPQGIIYDNISGRGI